MLNKLAIAAVAGTAAWISWHYVTKVSKPDIYAHNDFVLPIRKEPLRAGDVVMVPEDPSQMERICDLNLESVKLNSRPVDEVYYNTLRASLPEFTDVVIDIWKSIRGQAADEGDTAAASYRRIHFKGEKTALGLVEEANNITDSCQCQMAVAMARGDRVCTVNASLIETQLQGGVQVSETVAVTLARHTNYVPEPLFAVCKEKGYQAAVYNDKARLVAQKLCSESALPIDVRWRKRFNVIDKQPGPTVTPAREAD
jgi:hypothetical protein